MFNCNNGINGFGMGINTGMGMMPTNVKITQKTTGGGSSIFGGYGGGYGNSFGGGFSSSTTSYSASYGPRGFLGGLAGFLAGFSGGGMFGGMGMSGVGGFGGFGSSSMTNPLLSNIGYGTTSGAASDPELSALNNLNKGGKYQITRNPDGTFTALLESKYNKAGTQATATGNYTTIQQFICNTETIDPSTTKSS
ncbi:MAG: hypothetical protein NC191_03675 [Muribaculaceae bacterium]|nr:hypothetical protein [Muribaculaceae bacterium]